MWQPASYDFDRESSTSGGLEQRNPVVLRHAPGGIQDEHEILRAGRAGHVPRTDARVVRRAACVVVHVFVPDDAGEVDEHAILGAVEQPLGIALLDHAAVEVAQRGVDVCRLARRALDGVRRRVQQGRRLHHRIGGIHGPTRVAAAARAVAVIEVAEWSRELSGARGVDLARGVGERAVAYTEPRSLERELEIEHRVLLVIQRRVERRGGLRVRGGKKQDP